MLPLNMMSLSRPRVVMTCCSNVLQMTLLLRRSNFQLCSGPVLQHVAFEGKLLRDTSSYFEFTAAATAKAYPVRFTKLHCGLKQCLPWVDTYLLECTCMQAGARATSWMLQASC